MLCREIIHSFLHYLRPWPWFFSIFLEFWPLSSSVPFYPKVAVDENPVFSSPLTASFLSCTHCPLPLWGCSRIPVVAVGRSETADGRVFSVRTTTACGAQVMFSDSLLKIVVTCFRRRSWISLTPFTYLRTIYIKMLNIHQNAKTVNHNQIEKI